MHRFILFALFATACGPQVSVSDDGGTTEDPHDPTLSGTTTDPRPPATSGDPVDTTGSVPPSATFGDDGTSSGQVADDEDGSGFLVRPDGLCGPALPPGTLAHCSECDLWAQDCPAGEKCTPWSNDGGPHWNANRCVPIDPDPAQVGEPCTMEGSEVSGIDDCDIGQMCLYVDPDTLQGTCVSLCTGSADDPSCADGLTCAIDNDGAITLCLSPCDPLADDCVLGTCIPVSEDFVCFADGTAAAPAEPCERPVDCAAGSTCLPTDTAGCGEGISECCTSYCDLLAPDPNAACLPGQTCTPWYRPGTVMPPLDAIGVCRLPA